MKQLTVEQINEFIKIVYEHNLLGTSACLNMLPSTLHQLYIHPIIRITYSNNYLELYNGKNAWGDNDMTKKLYWGFLADNFHQAYDKIMLQYKIKKFLEQ